MRMDQISPDQRVAPPPAETLPDMLAQSGARFGDRPAVEFLGRRWTYSALGALVARAARGLQAAGVTPGMRVALCLPNTPYYVIYYFAALQAGAIVVGCNPLYVERELVHQLNDAGAEVLVTVDLEMIAAKLRAAVPQTQVRLVVVCPMAAVLPAHKGLLYRAFRRRETARMPRDPAWVRHADIIADATPPAPVPVAPGDIAALQYTGGTTGVPKGAMLTHGGLLANARQVHAHFPSFEEGRERMLAVLPLFHVFALTALLNAAVLTGAELILQPRFVLDDLMRAMERQRPTIFAGVPTLYAAINDACARQPRDLSSLKVCVSGGAPLPAEVRDRFKTLTGCRLVEGYGLTECSGVATCNPPDGVIKNGSIGVPMQGTVIELRDIAPPHAIVPQGERGEICIRGPQVMAGYWHNPAATEAVMIDGALRTGDIGRVDEDGYVYVLDRLKELILCSGYNVYPSVIEAALYSHPAVAEALVIGVPDPYRGQAPVAFVALHPGQEVTPAALRAHLETQISKIEMPKAIEIRASLPRTMVGKLSKKELAADYAARPA
ncbi:fatty-acid (long-chain)--CoA ligase [Acidisphaera rubrifaciens HS-AP3]|uniref:Fatty-acid (Long-chain)--CoA ligase n=2 Tax=Acidisphaera TaxID=50714 RepID=A0A0D6PAD1_9PROT|nr:fatty-acid (long-chain)--CoA ligase [Acidisphaera rubrifaciens HS-AP3]